MMVLWVGHHTHLPDDGSVGASPHTHIIPDDGSGGWGRLGEHKGGESQVEEGVFVALQWKATYHLQQLNTHLSSSGQ